MLEEVGPSSSGPGERGEPMGKETDGVMVHFMCQLDWAMGIPGDLVMHGEGVEQIVPPSVGGPHPIRHRPE